MPQLFMYVPMVAKRRGSGAGYQQAKRRWLAVPWYLPPLCGSDWLTTRQRTYVQGLQPERCSTYSQAAHRCLPRGLLAFWRLPLG
jgi:hypothetical protein